MEGSGDDDVQRRVARGQDACVRRCREVAGRSLGVPDELRAGLAASAPQVVVVGALREAVDGSAHDLIGASRTSSTGTSPICRYTPPHAASEMDG
jgi:hypothetical protein